MFANPYHCILHSQYLIQMKLSTTATLGTEKSGHCREMVVVEAETTVSVRTIRLKKWPLYRGGRYGRLECSLKLWLSSH